MWVSGSDGVEHWILGRYEPEIAIAGTRERRAAELQQQARSEALESALRAAQQLQLPTLDIGLDEIQAIEAQPFHHAVDCRQRHDLLRYCLPALGWLSQVGKAEPEAAAVLQRDSQGIDPKFRAQRHWHHVHIRQSVQPDDGAEDR